MKFDQQISLWRQFWREYNFDFEWVYSVKWNMICSFLLPVFVLLLFSDKNRFLVNGARVCFLVFVVVVFWSYSVLRTRPEYNTLIVSCMLLFFYTLIQHIYAMSEMIICVDSILGWDGVGGSILCMVGSSFQMTANIWIKCYSLWLTCIWFSPQNCSMWSIVN